MAETKLRVAIRVRPLRSTEGTEAWRIEDENVYQNDAEQVVGRTAFRYDAVYGEQSDTRDVYEGVCRELVDGALKGVNGTIFAYGQTSSGKTFTIQGGDQYGATTPGLMHLAAEHIFATIEARNDTDFLLRVSYLEVYNEQLRDLLAEDGTGEVHIREHPETGVYVEGAQEIVVTQPHDVADALVQGEKRRAIGSTAMNERSSRSHTVFRIVVESRPRECAEDHGVLVGALSLVDLAGSESVRLTGATGMRQKEGGKINQSLLTLSRVVQQLGEKGKENFVNFRDSRLTRLLQPTLSGKAQLAMVCCVAPSCNYVEETRSTLQFGSRAARVTLKPVVHEILDDASQLRRVKRQLAELLAKQETADEAAASGKTEELHELLERNEKLEADLAQRASKMTELTKMICVGGTSAAASKPRRRRRATCAVGARGFKEEDSNLPAIPSFAEMRAKRAAAAPALAEEEEAAPPPPPADDGVLEACLEDDRAAEARGLPALDAPAPDDLEAAVRARLRRAAEETLAVSSDADETVSELRKQLEVEKEVAEEVEGERTKAEAEAEALKERLAQAEAARAEAARAEAARAEAAAHAGAGAEAHAAEVDMLTQAAAEARRAAEAAGAEAAVAVEAREAAAAEAAEALAAVHAQLDGEKAASEAALDALRAELAAERDTESQSTIEALQAKVDAAAEALQAADAASDEVEEGRREAEAEHEAVKTQLAEAQAARTDAEAALAALQEERAADRENAKLTRDAESQATIEALQAKVDAAAEARWEADAQLASAAEAATAAHQCAAVEHEAVLRRAREEGDAARAQVAQAEEAASIAEAARAEVEAERDEERSNSDGVRGERDALHGEVGELRTQIERERQQARDAAEARACEAESSEEADATIAELRRQLEVEREVGGEAEAERDALAKRAEEQARDASAAHLQVVRAKDERIACLEKVKMTTAIFAQIQKLRTDKEAALSEARELKARVASLTETSASPKEAAEDTALAARCAASDAACRAATEKAARLEARAARAEQSMSKIRTPGGRRALNGTDALHDKIEFLEQENLDLMLEVKQLKASQARLAASPVPVPTEAAVVDENAPPGPSPSTKLSAAKLPASPAAEAGVPTEGTQECTQS